MFLRVIALFMHINGIVVYIYIYPATGTSSNLKNPPPVRETIIGERLPGIITQVFADLDYCGKRFGDNRRFQYTAEKGPVMLAV